ncbi:MAG: aryl-sulfate sulfotransferase [Bacteroidales bacterium]|nr:aryl-sulfate sulfotransferase [Bacteroidales bacterium]
MNNKLEIVDSITTQNYVLDKHDFEISDSGNIILLGRSFRTVDMSTIVDGENSAATVYDVVIQEFDKNKNLLYIWNSADYFKITDANEESPFIDFTASVIDYVHANSITIDSDTSLLLSCRHTDKITKINRRTGNVIWRLGGRNNDFSYNHNWYNYSVIDTRLILRIFFGVTSKLFQNLANSEY